MASELKPCPFCRHKPIMIQCKDKHGVKFVIYCASKECRPFVRVTARIEPKKLLAVEEFVEVEVILTERTKKLAIKNWNKRR